MFYINKIVYFFCNPVMIGLLPFAVGLFFLRRGCRKAAWWSLGFAFGWMWFCSTLTPIAILGLPLEKPYLTMQRAEDAPQADAIVLLGGGMGATIDGLAYPEMFDAADRVWHAARLWKAGKAPFIVCSGTNESRSSVPLLKDFGVPEEAIKVDDESRNTYENARFTERLLANENTDKNNILLVTSAWHLPRALGNFSKTSLVCYPAPADFAATYSVSNASWWSFLLPQPGALERTSFLFKEWLGRLARR